MQNDSNFEIWVNTDRTYFQPKVVIHILVESHNLDSDNILTRKILKRIIDDSWYREI